MESSLCEKPERHASRKLSDHLTFEGQKQKVHSLVDKVYSRKNLTLAWERVRANQGASGADRVTIGDFEAALDENLERLHRELRDETYQPQAVRRLEIPKRGSHRAGRDRNRAAAQRIGQFGEMFFILAAAVGGLKVYSLVAGHTAEIGWSTTMSTCLSAATGAFVGNSGLFGIFTARAAINPHASYHERSKGRV
jgi:hypothetical protein